MHVRRHSRAPSIVPPESGFLGEVRIEGYFRRTAPSRLAGATVSLGPGARTPWKTNAVGQTVVVTHGSGRAGTEHHGVVEIGPGDVVWFPPGQPHWEGAAPHDSVVYLAFQEEDEEGVRFLHEVTDAEYALDGLGAR